MAEAYRVASVPPLQVSEEKYSAALVMDEAGPRVVLRGTVSTINPAQVLNPFVDAVHGTVKGIAPEVRIDLRELEFCNSSGFKAFVHWIELVHAMPEGDRYRLHFLSSPTRKWQKTSLLALSCYGVNTVTLD